MTVQQWTSFLIFELGKAEPKTEIVVAVVGRVVVAIRNATMLRIVVPATATIHTIRTLMSRTLFFRFSKRKSKKKFWATPNL